MSGRRKSRTGTITEERGRWRARGPLREDGTRESLGTYETRAEAVRTVRAASLLDADRPTGLTLGTWSERWFAERSVRGERQERSSWRTHIAQHPIADRLIRRLSRVDVEAWLRDVQRTEATQTITYGRGKSRRIERRGTGQPIGRQTAQHALRVLRACLDGAAAAGHIAANPAADVRLAREMTARDDEDHEIVDGVELDWTWLTTNEIDRLLSVGPRHDTDRERAHLERCRTIWIVAIYTGMRPGELWGLRWCDVRLDGPHPKIQVRRSRKGPPKTRRARRDIPLLPVVVDALRAWQRTTAEIGERLVFPSDRDAQTCHAEGYDAGLAVYRRIAGIDRPGIVPYTWRHTCASHLIQGTWTARPLRLEEVARWHGHSSITVTQRYAHLAPGAIRDLISPPIGREVPDTDLTIRKR